MDNELDELANFLENEEDKPPTERKLDLPVVLNTNEKEKSEIHNGDTDSSDDEDNKYTDSQKYTDSGRAIKKYLGTQTNSSPTYSNTPTWKTKTTPQPNAVTPHKITKNDVFSDPFFGIRIVTPLISSQAMKERMTGKTAVPFSRLEKHLVIADKSSDWVLAGVIVSKFIKTSQKGNPYVCWTLSDLRDDLATVSIFLFGKAYKDLWKTTTHVVVAILNPTPLENRKSSKDIAALSVLNPDQVMMWGQSKDLGVCKARKKNGDPCTSFVNKNQCEFCIYHVKKEYGKFTSRSELQSSSGGSLNQLRNKVIGKNEIFYAGKSFTSVPAKPNQKQIKKDKTTLSQLFNKCESRLGPETLPMTKKIGQSSRVMLMKDAERLQKLTGSPATRASLDAEKYTPEPHATLNSSTAPVKIRYPGEQNKLKSSLGKADDCFTKTKSGERMDSFQKKVQKPKSDGSNIKDKLSAKKEARVLNKTPNSSTKIQATKHRFENLIKLKTTEILPSNNTFKQPSNPVRAEESSYNVCFEFDDNLESKCPLDKRKDTPRPTITDKKCFFSNFSKGFSEGTLNNDKISNNDCQQKSKILINSRLNEKNSSINQRTPKPLCERKPPTKQELELNTSHLNTNYEAKNIKVKEDKEQRKSHCTSPDTPLRRVKDLVHNNSPKLGVFSSLNVSVPSRSSNAKVNALKYVKMNGPIKYDESEIKKKKIDSVIENKRKRLPEERNKEGITGEKVTLSERFKELMNMTSKHEDLITAAENEAMDNYYEKMEKKEQMEEKMLTTYKVECKAFKCLKCHYKWFSPSELCKAEKHPIKMISATKRFFQCHNCKNRTISLEIIPLHPCSNCGQSNWERASMMREKKSSTVHLSIRGGEQTFINSVETDTNLNLLVPE